MMSANGRGDARAPQWLVALPRLTSADRDLAWLRSLCRQLQLRSWQVSWAVPKLARDLQALEGVMVYPAFDLTDAHDLHGPHADPVQHNVDGPRPFADRLGHVWGAFQLGADDVCLVPNARLSDLQALWSSYAFADLGRAPVSILRITEFKPFGAQAQPSLAALLDELRWVAYRLQALDLLGKKVLLWPASPLIAAILTEAGLPCLPRFLPLSARPMAAALLAFPAASRAEARLADALRKAQPEWQVESLPAGPKAAAGMRWLDGAALRAFEAAVFDADLLPTLARVQLQVSAAQCVVVGVASMAGMACVPRLSAAASALALAQRSAAESTAEAPERGAEACLALLDAVDDARRAAVAPQPFVLHIAPAWAGAGSSHVFATQLQWLHERGANVVCLHLDTDDIEANEVKGGIAGRLQALPGGRALHRWFLSRPLADRALERETRTPSAYDYFSLEGEERIARQVAIPDSLHQFLRHREVQFVLLNYGHNWPMVERLGLASAPVMIETHDVRPVQHGLYNEEPTVESAVTLELGMFARATCAVFINDAERAHFSKAHPETPAVAAFPFQDEPEAPMLRSRFETPASTALGALALPLDIVDEIFKPRDQRTRRFAVFVGSTHKANVFSLEWFLTQVYPLGLMDPRLVILIVGSVGEALLELNLPNVYCTGRLPDLQPIYAAADVILLPIRIGTGLPIKSLDALTAGTPLVATRAAIAAIPGLIEAVGAFDEPEAFAARVLALAFDADEAAQFRERVDRLKASSARWSAYAAAWEDVIRALPGAASQPRSPAPPPPRTLAPTLGAPAGAAAGEFYFWAGHGLEEWVGAEFAAGGLQICEPYFRLGLQCWVAGSSAAGLQLSFRLSSDIPVRCLVAIDGEARGGLTLGADPVAADLALPLAGQASVRCVTLELRFEASAEGFAGALLSGLVARPLGDATWEEAHV